MRRLVGRTGVVRAAVSILSVVGVGLAVSACGSESVQTLRVYTSLPLGLKGAEEVAADIVRGEQMALRDAHGRAGDYPVRLIALDDVDRALGQWDPGVVRANAERAARDPDAVAYIGDMDSGATAIAMPILNRAGLLQVSPGSTAVGLTVSNQLMESPLDTYQPTGERTFARIIPHNRAQAQVLARLMAHEGVSRLFVLDSGGLYGRDLADEVARAAPAHGVKVVARETVLASTAPDIRALARRVSSTRADAVFYGGVSVDGREGRIAAAALVRGLAAADGRLRFFGGDGLANSAFAHDVGPAGSRVVVTAPGAATSRLPARGKRFSADFKRSHGRLPNPFAIYGYEAMSAILDAVRRAEAASGRLPSAVTARRRAVVKAFMTIKDRDSALGTYSVDANGDTTLRTHAVYSPMKGKLVRNRRLTTQIGSGNER